MTLERIAQDVARTKQSAHANVHVGRVVGVRNAQRDGVPIGPLWDVEITNRRGIPFVAKDLRSAVPLQVGHEVFCTWQDGDFTRGGYIISQTTEPVRQSAGGRYEPEGEISLWNGNTSDWVLGIAGGLAATQFHLKDIAQRLPGDVFMVRNGAFPAFGQLPDIKYRKFSVPIRITSRRMQWEFETRYFGHVLETIQAGEYPVTWGMTTNSGPIRPVVYWILNVVMTIDGSPVMIFGVPSDLFYAEELPLFRSTIISELDVTKVAAVTNVEVMGAHPHNVTLTRADFVQDIGSRKIGISGFNALTANNFLKVFDFDCTGFVGLNAELHIYVQMRYGDVSTILIRPDTHKLASLFFNVRELGIGSALPEPA